jgi:hypothetical protein
VLIKFEIKFCFYGHISYTPENNLVNPSFCPYPGN